MEFYIENEPLSIDRLYEIWHAYIRIKDIDLLKLESHITNLPQDVSAAFPLVHSSLDSPEVRKDNVWETSPNLLSSDSDSIFMIESLREKAKRAISKYLDIRGRPVYYSLGRTKNYTVDELVVENSKQALLQLCQLLNIKCNQGMTKKQVATKINKKLQDNSTLNYNIARELCTDLRKDALLTLAKYYKAKNINSNNQELKVNFNTLKDSSGASLIPVAPVGISDKFRNIKESCSIPMGWTIRQKIGQGSVGMIYLACKLGKCDYILKKQPIKSIIEQKMFTTEVLALAELQDTGTVPKIEAAWKCKNVGFILIEKVNCDSWHGLSKQKVKDFERYKGVKKLLAKIKRYGWLHVDVTKWNVCETDAGKLVLIDFGRAVKKGTDLYYKDHITARELNYPLNFEELEIVQESNLNRIFNLNYDIKARQESDKNFIKLTHKIQEYHRNRR